MGIEPADESGDEADIGREELQPGDLVEGDPAVVADGEVGDFRVGVEERGDGGVKLDAGVLVAVLEGWEGIPDRDPNAEFFQAFSSDCLGDWFGGFYLAAGELPVSTIWGMRLALRDQDAWRAGLRGAWGGGMFGM